MSEGDKRRARITLELIDVASSLDRVTRRNQRVAMLESINYIRELLSDLEKEMDSHGA